MRSDKIKKGFTLLETLMVMAITAIILAIVVNSFYSLVKSQALDKDYISVVSLIERAKSLSINSKSDSQYGIYFSSSTVALFKGSTYLADSVSNQDYVLNNRVNISSINLNGANNNQITFDKLTGYASASGTVSLSLKDNSLNTKTIVFYKTGVIEYR